jgi:hypothetical protein
MIKDLGILTNEKFKTKVMEVLDLLLKVSIPTIVNQIVYVAPMTS